MCKKMFSDFETLKISLNCQFNKNVKFFEQFFLKQNPIHLEMFVCEVFLSSNRVILSY